MTREAERRAGAGTARVDMLEDPRCAGDRVALLYKATTRRPQHFRVEAV